MDIFTHMFFSYLINFGIGSLKYNEYAMVFGIALGMLPDFDILWYPLGKKIPIAKHRGISHSILFIFIATIILSVIFAPIMSVKRNVDILMAHSLKKFGLITVPPVR